MKWDRIKDNLKPFKNGAKQWWYKFAENYLACEFDDSRYTSKVERDQIGLWQNHQECNHRYK